MNEEDNETIFHKNGESVTWKELEEILFKMTEDEKLSSIRIYDADEDAFYEVEVIKKTTFTDVLDDGELYLQIN